ncbi:hypothetical protein L1887_38364 [Cichorium endivia]|nr:hypothetical protein L1887_38364 [Cichorium endivia]
MIVLDQPLSDHQIFHIVINISYQTCNLIKETNQRHFKLQQTHKSISCIVQPDTLLNTQDGLLYHSLV